MHNPATPDRLLLVLGCLFGAAVIAALGLVGIIGIRTTAASTQHLTDDELATLSATSQLSRDSKDLQLGVQALTLAGDRGRRIALTTTIYNERLPAVEASLLALDATHSAVHGNEPEDLTLLTRHWAEARRLLNSSRTTGDPVDPLLAEKLGRAFAPFDAQLEDLAEGERADAVADGRRADDQRKRAELAVVVVVVGTLLALGVFGWYASRRARRESEPFHQQAEFSDALQMTESEEEAHSLLHRHLERRVRGSEVAILNRNNSADRLEATAPLAPDSALRVGLEHAEPRSCLAIRSGSTHQEDSQGLVACIVCGPCPGRSLCTPLTVGGEVIGAVLVNRGEAYSRPEEQWVHSSVTQAAPVLANLRNLALAEQRAATDSLTGLPNKRTVADTIKQRVAAAARSSTPLCLLMLDLDHFRNINERFGHPVGDQALATVGASIRSSLREGDFAGRNGGEEFVVLLPDTDLDGGLAAAEKIRAGVAQIRLPGFELTLTVSIGVAAYPDHAASADRLERSADAALYVAKRSGRNRVEVATTTGSAVPDDARELDPKNGTQASV